MTPPADAVPFAKAEIVPEAQEAALEVLRSGWITMGPRTAEFEQALARYLGARHVIAVASCTAAIEIALRALRLGPGAAVLTPSLTFCGAVAPIVQAGLRPVLVDVDADTFLPTPATVAQAARRAGRPAAMIVQHMAGHPADVPELAAAAGLPVSAVIEDAAHGLGAELRGTRLGGASRAACFSFYATKNLPIGEGGAIATDDDELAGYVRTTRLHGLSRDAWRRYLPGGSWRYDVAEPGLKANITDIQAAIGLAQLTMLPRWQERRTELAAGYDAALAGLPGLGLPARPGRRPARLASLPGAGDLGVRHLPRCRDRRADQPRNRHLGALHPGAPAFRVRPDPRTGGVPFGAGHRPGWPRGSVLAHVPGAHRRGRYPGRRGAA